MISQLRGRVVGMDGDALVVDVGGVGFRVSATAGARALAGQSGNEARLFTEMVVREDSIDLFGFETAQERELFGILREVKGVGPKTADAILRERSRRPIREVSHLAALGLRDPQRALPFILLDGRAPMRQMALF